MSAETKRRILLVDDDVRNLRVLEGTLAPLRYELASVENGEEALASFADDPPDLVLLDVMMPGLSGYDVCRRMKETSVFVPVVLVTALDDRDSMVTGLDSGADDFISKPVDGVELRARVQSLLRSKAAHDDLRESYEQLKEAEAARDTLTHMLVHDLRNPLTAMHGYMQLLQMMDLSIADPRAPGHVLSSASSISTMLDMVDGILDIAKMEAGEMKLTPVQVDLSTVVDTVEETLGGHTESRSVTVERRLNVPEVSADVDFLRRVLINIVGNAIAYSPRGGTVMVASDSDGDQVRVTVSDEGPGIPEAQRELIFEKFKQADGAAKARSSGLGLAFCKLAVEAHGGRIGVEDGQSGGSAFWFVLPLNES